MKKFMSGFFSFLFLSVVLNGGIMATASAQDQNIWNPMFDEIRMTRKPNNQSVYQDVMTFKFGNTWAPYPFKVNLDNATIALFPKIKGPNDPTGTLEWDQDWKGEIWTADRSVPEVNANLIFTFDKNTETIIIPRDRIYDTTQLIVRLKGLMPDGSEILYDQFFLSLSTDPGETGGVVEGGGQIPPDPTIVIQVPCYVSSLAPYSSLVESSGGMIDFLVNTSLDSCSWNPTTTSDFIMVPENNFTGSKTVSLTVMENTSTEPRVGSVNIDGYEFTIFQKGVPVEIPEIPDYGYSTTINPANIIVGTNESTGSFEVVVGKEDAEWNVVGDGFLIVEGPTTRTGNSIVNYRIPENTSQEGRVGTITAAGGKFFVYQRGIVVVPEIPDYGYSTTINPSTIIIDPEEVTGSFDVVVGNPNTQWNIEVDDFMVVEGPTVRTGNSTVNYRILQNTSFEGRVGSITAAGGRFFVYQRGLVQPPIELSKFITQFTPEYFARSYQGSSGADSFSVKTNKQDCLWSATVNTFGSEPWVTLTNSQGNGDGVVTYTVSKNPNFTPRFAEIKVTTSDGHYRVFPIVQEATPLPYVVEWGRRFTGPTLDDFSINVSSYTMVSSEGQSVRIGLKVANADDMTWQLWASPWEDNGEIVSREMVATGVGNSWDNVPYEDAITLTIPPLNDTYTPRVFKLSLVFIPTTGEPITTKREYHIIQRGQREVITETVEVVTEVPAKFIKNIIPPFTVVQGVGGDFQFEVEPSVGDCSWQATTDVDWVGFIVPQPVGGLIPPLDLLPKSRSMVGRNNLAFRVQENNTSDVRICVIPMSVWPNGFTGGFEETGAFVNAYHTIIQVPKPGAIRLIIDGKVDVIPTSNIPFNVNVTYEPTETNP
jgi:hypothetical protein